jgi:Cu(I)/Ag(I) efflux system membrane fusion protein
MSGSRLDRVRTAAKVAAILAFGLVLGLLLGGPGEEAPSKPPETTGKVQWYTCSMHPQIRLRDPNARCPICGMALIPVPEEGEGGDASSRRLVMSEEAKALAEVETAPVERRFVTKEIRLVGKIDYDETALKSITAWVPGRLERLYVDYTGVAVTKGAKLVDIYSPELLVAQQGLLEADRALRDMKASGASASNIDLQKGTVGALEERLSLWGLTAAQIAEIRSQGTASDRMTILSPISGIVIHKMAVEGDYVSVGTKIYGIADLSTVWIYLDAYESDMAWIRYAQEVEFEAEAYPGEVFRGRISFVDPFLDEKTRTVRLRVTADNAQGRLKPGMFVRARILAKLAAGGQVVEPFLEGKWVSPVHPEIVRDAPGECPICGTPLVSAETLGYAGKGTVPPLVVPATAPLRTGRRAVVYVEVPDAPSPTYEGRVILLGPRAKDSYIVEDGLEEGERVVVKGNFKIDSALQIRARPSMMSPPGEEEEKGPGKEKEKPAPVEAPQAFVTSLTPLYRACLAAQRALAADDLAGTQAAFTDVAAATKVGADLEGPARDAWADLGARLARHAKEGAGAADLAAARDAFRLLSGDALELVRRFGQATGATLVAVHCPMAFDKGASWLQEGGDVRNPYFGKKMLDCGDVEDTFPSAAVPSPAMREAVTAALPSYLAVQAALASDDLAAAQAAAGTLAAAAEKTPTLRDAAGALRDAKEIEAARRAFALASDALLALVRVHGFAGPDDLAWFHCPMAFGGRGAEWIQTGDEARNPYFGKAMPRCGALRERLEKGR